MSFDNLFSVASDEDSRKPRVVKSMAIELTGTSLLELDEAESMTKSVASAFPEVLRVHTEAVTLKMVPCDECEQTARSFTWHGTFIADLTGDNFTEVYFGLPAIANAKGVTIRVLSVGPVNPDNPGATADELYPPETNDGDDLEAA